MQWVPIPEGFHDVLYSSKLDHWFCRPPLKAKAFWLVASNIICIPLLVIGFRGKFVTPINQKISPRKTNNPSSCPKLYPGNKFTLGGGGGVSFCSKHLSTFLELSTISNLLWCRTCVNNRETWQFFWKKSSRTMLLLYRRKGESREKWRLV